MLREDLKAAMKDAMKAKDARRLSTIRLVLAAVKERDIENRTFDGELGDDDAMIMGILSKMVKQRNESIRTYEEAGRCELAEQEREEITVIEGFLPRQMSEDEVETAVGSAVSSLNAEGLKDIGRVMASLKEDYAGQMDFTLASKMVKNRLSQPSA